MDERAVTKGGPNRRSLQPRRLPHLALLSLLLLAPAGHVFGQGTADDYERSASLRSRWGDKLVRFRPAIGWLPDGAGVFWKLEGEGLAKPWITVSASDGERQTHEKIDAAPSNLAPQAQWGPSPAGGANTTIRFVNRLDRTVRIFWSDRGGVCRAYGTIAPGEESVQNTYAGHVWVLDFAANDLAGIFVAASTPSDAIIDELSRKLASGESQSPAPFEVILRDHNLVSIDRNGKETVLTKTGNESDPFRLPVHWSPDGKKFLAFQVTKVTVRRIPLIESSPKAGVQPVIQWIVYPKPGDPLAQARPRLFVVKSGKTGVKQIDVDDRSFEDSWSVGRVHWSADSKKVYCLYNRRGHQQLALRSIDAKSGRVKTLIDEKSKTFVDYSQKTFLHWLDESGKVLWASERDGWNHLYLYDQRRGRLIKQVTRGEWVVRQVEHVDAEKEQIWFTAMGIVPGQDPYHRHLARVNFDGSDLTVLTEGDGTHAWEFSPDRTLFIDRWSRVDQPTVTELRRSADGSLVAELGRDSTEALEKAGLSLAQRFVAKGRDGKTDIHGIIVRPSNFAPGRKYPVIEAIYAGPHGHHVPKSWRMLWKQRELAELGFIVVQIDGMGTNWRSKSFHDVCWQNLKDGGFPDRIAWLRAAAKAHPELDLSRVGIYGGSAGGQNALAALLHHGDFYRAAAADCGCHDNRMDKIWWNEAWMGKLGPHYEENSNVTHAGKLRGKLLLTVGELDRNVDPASTLQVVDALIRAEKEFEFVLVPGAGHGIGEAPYMVRRRQDFFVRALYGAEPRR